MAFNPYRFKTKCVEHVANLRGDEPLDDHFAAIRAAEEKINRMTHVEFLELLEEVMTS